GGSSASDRYLFDPGHGHDVIDDYAQNEAQADSVVFRQAQSAGATFDHVGNDLVIHAYGDDNSVTLKNYFSSDGYRRYHLVFDDATLNAEQVLAREYTFTGTDGNDALYGWNTDDTLLGGAGNDWLYGQAGHDTLIGGTGDDYLSGGSSESDRYLFDPGHGHDVIDDYAQSEAQADTVVFRQAQSAGATFDHVGNDLVIHAYGDDNSVTLKNYFSSDGYRRYHLVFDDVTLNAEQVLPREYTLTGTADNDWLIGWSSHDVLTGGTGDDYLAGGSSASDRYLFDPGHGHDVIDDYAQNEAQADTVVFRQAQSAGATFNHVGNDLVIHAYGDDNSVTLKNYFSGDGYRRYHMVFDDVTLNAEQVLAREYSLTGTAGNDQLIGWSSHDVLTGGAGDDYLAGGSSASDRYLFDPGHGHDVIDDYAQNEAQADTVVFRQARSDGATFDHVGNDLVIHAYGDDNSVTLKNYFSNDGYRRYHLVFDDATLNAEQVLAREYSLTGTAGNDQLIGWSSHDVLTGGAGDDYLAGGSSASDRYLFDPGHGHDVIDDYAQNEAQADTVVFRQARSDGATFNHVGNDLVIHAYGDDNSVTLKDYFYGENYQRFSVSFDNVDIGYPALHDCVGQLQSGQSMSLSDPVQISCN
ncbi:TPA: calcium-binding protein, partial [Klebsiella oxytoca]|nr:calcium-binding protein [Klebsiella oxytoca]